jgi:hypothetical protein
LPGGIFSNQKYKFGYTLEGYKNIPNGHKIGTPTFYIPRPSKIYPNRDFWYGNIPSGNPGVLLVPESHRQEDDDEKCFWTHTLRMNDTAD